MSIERMANPTTPDTAMLCSAGALHDAAIVNPTDSETCPLFTIESRLL